MYLSLVASLFGENFPLSTNLAGQEGSGTKSNNKEGGEG
jgi:hypothetical protein